MSIGKQITEGGKGRNYPYQHNVLKGLQRKIELLNAILNNLGSLEDLATEDTLQNVLQELTPVQRTANILRPVDQGGAILAQTYSFSVSNVGGEDGTIQSVTIKPGETINFDAGGINNFYPTGTINYNATGTEFLIIYNT